MKISDLRASQTLSVPRKHQKIPKLMGKNQEESHSAKKKTKRGEKFSHSNNRACFLQKCADLNVFHTISCSLYQTRVHTKKNSVQK